jgi:flagellar basal-body rod protein FlgC
MIQDIYQVSLQGMAVERTRVEVATRNIANANAVAGTAAEAYRAQSVIAPSFIDSISGEQVQVMTSGSVKAEYLPEHPLADIKGMVYRPDIDLAQQMFHLNMASRAYEANIRAFNSLREMNGKALEIGK